MNGSRGAPRDAVGRSAAVGDVVTALVGGKGSVALVERVSGSRLVVRRGDGMKAVLNSGSVVVVQRVRQDGQERRPGGLAS